MSQQNENGFPGLTATERLVIQLAQGTFSGIDSVLDGLKVGDELSDELATEAGGPMLAAQRLCLDAAGVRIPSLKRSSDELVAHHARMAAAGSAAFAVGLVLGMRLHIQKPGEDMSEERRQGLQAACTYLALRIVDAALGCSGMSDREIVAAVREQNPEKGEVKDGDQWLRAALEELERQSRRQPPEGGAQ